MRSRSLLLLIIHHLWIQWLIKYSFRLRFSEAFLKIFSQQQQLSGFSDWYKINIKLLLEVPFGPVLSVENWNIKSLKGHSLTTDVNEGNTTQGSKNLTSTSKVKISHSMSNNEHKFGAVLPKSPCTNSFIYLSLVKDNNLSVQTAWRSKNKYWLAGNQDYMSSRETCPTVYCCLRELAQ